jgi:hypothetical protein
VKRWAEYWREGIGAIAVAISRLLTAPRTFWENDEFLFAEAVRDFDPSRYHPHPPGYPLYVGLGKALNAVFGDPFRSLVTLSVVACVVGFIALARAFRNYIDDPDLAVAGALLFYFSAAMLVHGTLALSDSPSIMFLALALWSIGTIEGKTEGEGWIAHQRTAIGVGLWCSAAIGCRPQLAIPVLPMFAVALTQMRGLRQRGASLLSFGFVSGMWFLPLMDAAGGWDKLVAYERKQAAYFVVHDAVQSRGARSAVEIVTRFILHTWGSKYITIPLVLLLILGIAPLWRRRSARLLPLAVFTIVQLAFELLLMDPADAARYSLPLMIAVSLLAVAGMETLRTSLHSRAVPWAATAAIAAMSMLYVRPLIAVRTESPSPVAAAADFANRTFAKETVILYDLSLRPAAEYLMKFKTMPIEAGLREYYNRPDMPLVLFVNGGSTAADARVFAWPFSDAYGKLTRNMYRQVSLDPIRPPERYLPLNGVYALERTTEGEEWRWLDRDARIALPAGLGSAVRLRLLLSPDTPYAENRVAIAVDGQPVASVTARRGSPTEVVVPLRSAGSPVLSFHSQQTFVPDVVLHNRDRRLLAVQLLEIEQERR